MMTDIDEKIIQAIRGQAESNHLEHGDRRYADSDPDSDVDSDDGSAAPQIPELNGPLTKDQERMLSDSALRRHYNLGGAKTGPKGVMADYKFHQKQERARRELENEAVAHRAGMGALSSGWLQRQIAAEKAGSSEEADEEGDEELLKVLEQSGQDEDNAFLANYRQKRLQEYAILSALPKFGNVIDLTSSDEFLSAVDDEHPLVNVVISLYQPSSPSSRSLLSMLPLLATKYPHVKFCRIVSHLADETFDHVALPAVLGYRAGDTVGVCLRVIEDARGASTTLEEVETKLAEDGVLDVELLHTQLGNLSI
ncbi:hypothetical protein HDU85_003002 [Gaertneriomyces sp. JEL0708]|nr:hypothetical protein HDU85_003002 [Gaertneriomyces sp. JEL0708]